MSENIQKRENFKIASIVVAYNNEDNIEKLIKSISSQTLPIKRNHHSATGIAYSPFKSFYIQRNRFFVIIKNFPIKIAILAILFTPVRYLLLLNSVN